MNHPLAPSHLTHLFNSAFRREDIHSKLSTPSHSRSFSSNSHLKQEKVNSFDSSQLNLSNQTVENNFTLTKVTSKYGAQEDIEYNNETKYLDMVKRYERMQEFYKTQVARLTEEVSHYKTLYHKLLNQQSYGRKISRD